LERAGDELGAGELDVADALPTVQRGTSLKTEPRMTRDP